MELTWITLAIIALIIFVVVRIFFKLLSLIPLALVILFIVLWLMYRG